jgi:hypothetical protein
VRWIVRAAAYGAEGPCDVALVVWRATGSSLALRMYLALARVPLALHALASRH